MREDYTRGNKIATRSLYVNQHSEARDSTRLGKGTVSPDIPDGPVIPET
jgi:hypothetical protein